jgi:hypothetical protein
LMYFFLSPTLLWYDMIWYDTVRYDIWYDIFNCNWVAHPVSVVQYTYTHKQYRKRHKTYNT